MQQCKRHVLSVLMVAMVVLLLVSCGTFNKNSYRGLGVMRTSVDIGLKSANDLYNKGLISPEGKAEVIKYGNSYIKGHNSAIDSFVLYLNASPEQKETEKGQAVIAMQAALSFYNTLLTILADHGVYGEPVEPWF